MKLGNLALLEATINASVSNQSFETKAPGYRQSHFLLTKSIAERPKVGANTSLNRAVAELPVFESWSSSTIQQRQESLRRLAHSVWEVPDL